MPDVEDVGRQIAVHEAVCAERWKQANARLARLARIETVLGVMVLRLLVGADRSLVMAFPGRPCSAPGWSMDRPVLAAGVLEAFLAAGFTRANSLEVILAVGLKTLSNYVAHLAHTPPDPRLAANIPASDRQVA